MDEFFKLAIDNRSDRKRDMLVARDGRQFAAGPIGTAVGRLLLHPPGDAGLHSGSCRSRPTGLCRASKPSMPASSKRLFQAAIVFFDLPRAPATCAHVNPSASAKISFARNASPAVSVRDCVHFVSSSR